MVETARQSQIFSENRWQGKRKNRPKPPMLGIIGKIYEGKTRKLTKLEEIL